jgi:tape measure domain-containing protein
MPEYVLRIKVTGKDTGGVKTLNNLQRSLKTLGKISMAGLSAALVGVGIGIAGLVGHSVAAAAEIQQLTIALETLIAKEFARGDEAIITSQAVVRLTKKEREELQKLQVDYKVLAARTQEAKQQAIELSQAEDGTERLDYKTKIATVEKYEQRLGSLQKRIQELTNKEGSLATVTETVRVNQMDLTKALSAAAAPAQALLVQLRDLSLVSPYQFQQVADTFRFAMALGASSQEAIGMTEATMNMAAALGLNNEQLNRMQYNLAQAVIAGDLTNINLRQLKLVGVDLAEVFEDTLGMSIEKVRDQMKSGKMDYKDLAKAFQDYTKKYFEGAAERMTRTFTGLKNNIKDLVFFLGADFLGPTLDKFSTSLSGAFDTLRTALESGAVAEIGEKLTGIMNPFIEAFGELVTLDIQGFLLNMSAGFRELMLALGFDREATTEFITELYKLLKNLFGVDSEGGGGLGEMLSNLANTVLPKLTEGLAFVNEHWEVFRAAIVGIGAALAAASIAGILLTIAGALNPITLAIMAIGAAVSVLYTAWTENWGGIQEVIMPIIEVLGIVVEYFKAVIEDGNILNEFLTQLPQPFQDVVGAFLSVKEAISQVLEFLRPFYEAFAEVVGPAVQKLVGAFGEVGDELGWLKGAFEEFWEAIQPVIQAVLVGLGAAVVGIVGVIAGVIQGIATAAQPVLQGIIVLVNGIITAITGVINVIVGLVQGLAGVFTGDFEKVNEAASLVVTGLLQIFEGFGEILWGIFQTAIAGVLGFVAGFVDGIVDFFTILYEKLVGNSIIPDMLDIIVRLFRALPGDIVKAVMSQMKKFIRVGKDIVGGIKQGIEDAWDRFIDWLLSKIGGIIDSVKDFFGSSSPSRVFADEAGNWVAGLRVGWARSFGGFLSDIHNSMSRVSAGFPGLGGFAAPGFYPAAIPASGGGSAVQHSEQHNYHIHSAGAAALTMAIIEQQREERLNVFMGG